MIQCEYNITERRDNIMKHELPQIGEDFIQVMQSNGAKEHTTKSYRQILNFWIHHLKNRREPETQITELTRDFFSLVDINDLNAYMIILNEDGMSPNTRAKYVAVIKAFFNFLNLGYNPTLELKSPKLDKTEPEYMSKKECTILLDTIKNGKYENKVRDYAMVMTYLNTGARKTELIDLKLSSIKEVEDDEETYHVLKIKGKGGKERSVPLNEETLNAINEYLKIRPKTKSRALFIREYHGNVDKFSPSGIERIVKSYFERAGLSEDYHVHTFRHTFGTMLAANGVDVITIKNLMGHASLKTTEIYMHMVSKNSKKATASIRWAI
jgi:site-specific recombinase XerD